ncbi:MAG: TetR/AcrR family transcriptional regulator [Deltaproteobacteria bacterium]|nr:TetR/AcrR family transcriptional regulator [Deltaproteobacteria bacterium]
MKKDKTGTRVTTGTKKIDTVARICAAAKKIFSEYPYHRASIRMIGNAAGLNYPLIAYYFSTKSTLFEAVLSDVFEEYYQATVEWLNETGDMSATEGLSLYIDRLIEFTHTHPEALRIVLLNLVQADKSQPIPGYLVLQIFFDRSMPLFKQTSSARATDREIEKFVHNFNTLVINYLGAGAYYAGILGMAPDSPEYKDWVKENLMSLFLPLLKQLVR